MNKLQVFQHSGLSTGCMINMHPNDQFDDFELNNYEFFKFLMLAAEIIDMKYDYSLPLDVLMRAMYPHYSAQPDFIDGGDFSDPYEQLVSYIQENKDQIKHSIDIGCNGIPSKTDTIELQGYFEELLPVYGVAYALVSLVDGVKRLSIPYDLNFEMAHILHTHLMERHQDLIKHNEFSCLSYGDYLIDTIPMNNIALLEFCKKYSD